MAGFAFATPHAPSSGGAGHAGPLGFINNLVHDVSDAARGTPQGLVQLAEHPIRTAENVGKATWQTWSPLFHGHLGQFGHNLYQHPLAPMLDIATVFTGGASLAAKLGVGLSEAGLISGDSALARLGTMPTELKVVDKAAQAEGKNPIAYTKLLPKNPIYNSAYRGWMSFAEKHPAVPNWFGPSKVYSRLEHADWGNSHLALTAGLSAGMKAGEVFAKAGHEDWRVLEEQLHQSAYKDLLQNSTHVPVQDIITKYGGKLPDGYAPVRPGLPFTKSLFKNGYATNLDEFANHLHNLGQKFLGKTQDWQKYSFKDASGQDVVALGHRRAFNLGAQDGARSAHFLYKLYHYPTAIWKYAQVGASPRTIVDNTVGNWAMYIMRQAGAHGFHGFYQAIKYVRGQSKAMQFLKETGKLPEDMGPSYFRHFKGELGNTYGTATLGNDAGNTMSKLYKYSLYGPVHKYADIPVRAASISAYLRGDPLVQSLMKTGHSFEDAADTAVAHNPALRDRAIAHARTVAGNYVTLSKTEHVMRDLVPFYLWDKHIMMHMGSMLRDRPGVVAAGTGVGQQGANATRKSLGDIPSWMLGSIKLPFHVAGEGGRTTLVDTTGLNPYSTVPDIATLAQALTTGHTEGSGGNTVLSTVNPVIQGLVEQTMGKTATGAPVQSHGGILPSVLTSVFNSIRPVQLARTAAGAGEPSTSAKGTPRLYKTDLNTILSALAGFPIKEADMSHAVALQKQIENGGKKPKKGRGYLFAG